MPQQMFSKKIGENIEHIRLVKKKTIKEVANFLNLTDCGYRNIERGITEITLTKLFLIANYFNVPYSEILDIIEPEVLPINNSTKPLNKQLEDIYKQRIKDYKDEIDFLKKQITLLNEVICNNKLK